MEIKKRSLPMYIFLNIITLGIYGFVVSKQIGDEVNALCVNDNEEPHFAYPAVMLLRSIAPLFGTFVGLIFGIIVANVATIATNVLGFLDNYAYGVFSYLGLAGLFVDIEQYKAIIIFASMTVFAFAFTLPVILYSVIYHNYWWYRQAGRLKLNAGRYGLKVKESGADNLLLHTVVEFILMPITVVIFGCALLIPTILILLVSLGKSLGAIVFISILVWIFTLCILLFGQELTVGSMISMYFMFKNINRFSDACAQGAAPFDPMAYEYPDSIESKYPEFIPGVVNGTYANKLMRIPEQPQIIEKQVENKKVIPEHAIIGVKGSCAGYSFELTPGEELIVGKDAHVSQIVIDPAYKEVSRKHLGVTFNVFNNKYTLVDYSSNGTTLNEVKMTKDTPTQAERGSVIKLAGGKNVFRLS